MSLSASTHIGLVRLRVADLERALAFYRDLLGLSVVREEGSSFWLAANASEEPIRAVETQVPNIDGPDALLRLDEEAGAQPKPRGTTGLFHIAFRVPDRRALARAFVSLMQRRWPLQGVSDHAVSESLYLADPEGNGLEIYADRPREAWRYREGEIVMVTDPLDIDDLLRTEHQGLGVQDRAPGTAQDALRRSAPIAQSPAAEVLPPGTTVGHIHLQVSDLARAERFYAGVIGFDVTTRRHPGAIFMAAGGYHHHVAANVWSTRGSRRPPDDAAGLVEFQVVVGGAEARGTLVERARQAGVGVRSGDAVRLKDADGIVVVRSSP